MDYRTLLPTDLSGIRSRDAESAVVVAWGLSNYGSLGFPTNSTYVRLPQIVPELTARPLASLSCGAYYCLALVPGEGVYGWGDAAHGQLGDVGAPAVGAPRLLPFTAKKLIVAVAAGRAHALALRYEGVVLAWGDNRRGQLGAPGQLGSQIRSLRPFPSEVPERVTQVAAGGARSLALGESGALWGWGGAAGDGDDASEAAAVAGVEAAAPRLLRAAGGGAVAHIAAGDDHAIALVGANHTWRVWSTGANASGQLGRAGAAATTTAAAATVVAGAAVSAVVEPEALYAWGEARDGLLGADAPAGGVSAAPRLVLRAPLRAAAFSHTSAAAVARDGSLYTWGAAPLLAEPSGGGGGAVRRQPMVAAEASRRFNFSMVSCGVTHCVAAARCRLGPTAADCS